MLKIVKNKFRIIALILLFPSLLACNQSNDEDKKVELLEQKKPTEEITQNVVNNSFSPLATSALNMLFNKVDSSGTIKIANNKLATIWFEQVFDLKNEHYHVVFIYETELDEESQIITEYFSSASVDIVTYKKNNTEWDLIAAQKNVAVVGDFITVNGKPNGLGSDVIKISDDKLLFLIEETQESEIGDQLYVYEDKFKNVFLYDNNKWSYAGKISIAGTNKDYISNFQDIPIWDFKGSISVIENSNNKIPDLIVKKTGKELEFNSDNSDYKIIPARDEVYYFDDNRYIKVKKNTTVSNQNDNPIILVNTILSLSMDNGGIDKELEIQQIASQIISLPKKKSGDKKLARSLNDKGHIFLKNEDNENAIEMFEKAHIANPLDVEILNNLGYANTRIENLDAAEKYLIKTLALSPKRSTAWYNLGDAYGIKGDVNKAVACYANMYRFSSNRAKTHKFMKQTDENTDYEFGEDLESSRKKAIQSANSWFKF